MKKISLFLGFGVTLTLALFVAIGIFNAPSTNAADVSSMLIESSESKPTFEAPVRYDLNIDASQPVEDGYYRVAMKYKTDTLAQEIWRRGNNGSLDGYSLEKLNKSSIVAKVGALPPCGCHMPGACGYFRGNDKSGIPICEETCPPTCQNRTSEACLEKAKKDAESAEE